MLKEANFEKKLADNIKACNIIERAQSSTYPMFLVDMLTDIIQFIITGEFNITTIHCCHQLSVNL